MPSQHAHVGRTACHALKCVAVRRTWKGVKTFHMTLFWMVMNLIVDKWNVYLIILEYVTVML